MKLLAAALSIAIILVAVVSVTVAQAQMDDSPPPPSGITAVNGPNPGEVSLLWNAAAGANYYRVGWIADADYRTARDSGAPWLERFGFVDVESKTAYTITRLTPGTDYWFIVASNSERYGPPQWPQNWVSLRLNDDQSSCPTILPTPTPTPAPTPQTTPTPRPTPTGAGDYDADKDGLIEISNLTQLNAIRWDLDGDGSHIPRYAAAFPDAMPGMGCPSDCAGYELVADLDFDTNSNGEVDEGDYNDGTKWLPIGDESRSFNTTFDGNWHTISNLHTSGRYLGLFGTTGEASKIRRVGLISVSVSGNCYGCGQGGLVAINSGSISDSYATGYVSGLRPVGGLVGLNYGTIIGSYATSDVDGSSWWPDVGGLVGENHGTISASYATGNVSSSEDSVGGLVGRNYGIITASYATGNISSGYEEIGGLVGRNAGTIRASYAVGKVSGSDTTGYIGGLVGLNSGDVTHSYWNTETSGLAYSDGGVGKTTHELQSTVSYSDIYSDWNVDVDSDGHIDDPWDFGMSSQYPVLKYGGLSVAAQRP